MTAGSQKQSRGLCTSFLVSGRVHEESASYIACLHHDAPTNSGALWGGGKALCNHLRQEDVLGTEPLSFAARLVEADLEE